MGYESSSETHQAEAAIQAIKDYGIPLSSPIDRAAALLSLAFHLDTAQLDALRGLNYQEEADGLQHGISNLEPDAARLISLLPLLPVEIKTDEGLIEALKNSVVSRQSSKNQTKTDLLLAEARQLSVLNGSDSTIDTFMSQGVRKVDIARSVAVIQKARQLNEARKSSDSRTTDSLLTEAGAIVRNPLLPAWREMKTIYRRTKEDVQLTMRDIRMEQNRKNAEKKTEQLRWQQFQQYVDQLTVQMEFYPDQVRTPAKLRDDVELQLPAWIAHVRAQKTASTVEMDIQTRAGYALTLNSADKIPNKLSETHNAVKALEMLAIAEAKVRFLEANAPEHVTMPGFAAIRERAALRREARRILATGIVHPEKRGVYRKAAEATLLLALVTAACSPPSLASEPTLIAETPIAVTTAQPQKEASPVPTSTPGPDSYATEAAPAGVYGAPNLAESVYLQGSGGSGRAEILQAGIDETTMVNYENAAYAWAAAHGYGRGSVQIEYHSNGQIGDAYRWQMVLRNASNGNVLWAQSLEGGRMRRYPTGILVDPVTHAVQADATTRLVEIPNSANAKVEFVRGGFVVMLGGVPVTINNTSYYTEWYNTDTGQWEKIPEVEAAAPIRPFLAKEDVANFDWETSWGDPISYDQYVELYRQPSEYIQFDDSTPAMYINYKDSSTDSAAIMVHGIPGVNMFLEHAALVELAPGERAYHILMWKVVVKGPDGKNILIPWNTSHEQGSDDLKSLFVSQIRYVATAENLQFITLKIVTRHDQYLDSGVAFYEQLYGENPLRSLLQEGIIDPNIGDVFLDVAEISVQNPQY